MYQQEQAIVFHSRGLKLTLDELDCSHELHISRTPHDETPDPWQDFELLDESGNGALDYAISHQNLDHALEAGCRVRLSPVQ